MIKIKPTYLCLFLSVLLTTASTASLSDEKNNNAQLNPNASNAIALMGKYYSALNQQLDQHIKNRVRDPFSRPFASQQDKTNRDQPKAAAQFKAQSPQSLKDENTYNLPKMSFRGITQNKNKKFALLEIDGLGTFVVEEGDKVGLQQVVSSGAVLHILEINNLNLIVETGSYGQQMVVQ